MVKLSIKRVRFFYLNYFNKLVLNKNLQKKLVKRNNVGVVTYFGKKKSSNTVTLRAPKHFKVGRHHYHTVTRVFSILFKNFKARCALPGYMIYRHIVLILELLSRKKIAKAFSLLESVKLTVEVTDVFLVT